MTPPLRPFRFGVNVVSPIGSRTAWQERARRIEGDGWSTLLVPDHLGLSSAFAPLVSAADVTTSLRVGTLVVNNDFHRPLRLAQEAATVDLLTDGRLELGLGSGWARPEYEVLGVTYDRPQARAHRLADAVRVMKQAWAGQPALDMGSDETSPAVPRPAQRPHPPLLIGGHGDTILTLAAEEADMIGFTGLTWQGDRLQPTGASVDAFAERVAFVRSRAGDRFDRLELNVLVQTATVGDQAGVAVERVASDLGAPADLVRSSPLTLLGSRREVVEKVLRLREELGLSYFVVFDTALDDMAPVIAELAGR